MARFENHAVGGHVERLAVNLHQRANHRRNQVGTASHGLRKNHIGKLVLPQPLHGIRQSVEIAAEAGARHFADIETLRT